MPLGIKDQSLDILSERSIFGVPGKNRESGDVI